MTSKEVELTGGAPWGFRMHGGLDQNQPLRISRVNPGRKASLSGIREGDVITSINGQSTKNMTNSEAHAMLRSVGPNITLGLNDSSVSLINTARVDPAQLHGRPEALRVGARKIITVCKPEVVDVCITSYNEDI